MQALNTCSTCVVILPQKCLLQCTQGACQDACYTFLYIMYITGKHCQPIHTIYIHIHTIYIHNYTYTYIYVYFNQSVYACLINAVNHAMYSVCMIMCMYVRRPVIYIQYVYNICIYIIYIYIYICNGILLIMLYKSHILCYCGCVYMSRAACVQ